MRQLGGLAGQCHRRSWYPLMTPAAVAARPRGGGAPPSLRRDQSCHKAVKHACQGRSITNPHFGGDFVAVNLSCLDDFDLGRVQLTCWDGRHNNWQAGQRATPWPISA